MIHLKEEKKRIVVATKLTEKTPDPFNNKEQYQSFIRKRNTKSVKQSKIMLI